MAAYSAYKWQHRRVNLKFWAASRGFKEQIWLKRSRGVIARFRKATSGANSHIRGRNEIWTDHFTLIIFPLFANSSPASLIFTYR